MRSLRIEIHYPAPWMVPVHAAHRAVARDTEAWLRALGVVADAATEKKLAALDVGVYGGAPFTFAPVDRLSTITRFLSLWIFHDDLVEGHGDAPAHALGEAIRGRPDTFPGGSPAYRGWWEIGRALRATMSERWLAQHAERFAAWFRSVDDEARMVERARRLGRQPSLEAYLAVREINVGMYPTIDMIEHALGFEMDASIRADPDWAAAERLSSRAVALQNDLFGYAKDEEAGWTNAVRSAAAESGSLSAGLARIARLHDAYVDGLAAALHRLRRRHGDEARAFGLALGRVVAGLGRWHVTTPRYAVPPVLPSGEIVALSIAASEIEGVPSTPRNFAA